MILQAMNWHRLALAPSMCLPSPTVAQGQSTIKRLSLMRTNLSNNQQEITYTIHNPADVNRVKTRGKNIHTLHFFPSIPARNKEQSKNRGQSHPPSLAPPLLRARRASPQQVPRSSSRPLQTFPAVTIGIRGSAAARRQHPPHSSEQPRRWSHGAGDSSATPTEFERLSKHFP